MSNLLPLFLTKEDVEEVAGYLNLDYEYTRQRILNYDSKELAAYWNKANPITPKEIRKFYENNELYIFELTQANRSKERMEFHGKIIEYLLKNYPFDKYPRVLDYGSGVGDEVIKFSQNGYQVSFVDIPGKTVNFLKYRLRIKKITADFIPIFGGMAKLHGRYDIIICFDVLEHLQDPLRILRNLAKHLSANGVMAIINCPEDNGDQPCHLPSAFAVLGSLWQQTLDCTGLIPVKGHSNLYKKPNVIKSLANKIRYFIWALTSYYIIRVPKSKVC